MKKPAKASQAQTSKRSSGQPFLSPEWQLLLFILVIGVIYCVLFTRVYTTPYSAIGKIYFTYASNVIHGQIPYLDFNMEYPPLALLFFVLPRLAASSLNIYTGFYKAEVFLAILVGLFLIYLIARRMGKAPWKMMLAYTLCILAVGPIVAEQYDIFPAVLTLGSLYAFMAAKNKTAWALLALGVLTKIYPLFLAPVYLAIALRNRQYRAAGAGILVGLSIGIVLSLPFIIMNPDSIKALAEYHLQRGIQLESTYSSILLIGDKLGLDSVKLVFNFGSCNLDGKTPGTLARLSGYLCIIFLIAAYWFIYRNIKPGKSQSTRLGAYALLVLCVGLITGKVFSPQYLIWLVPLVPLIMHRGRYVMLGCFILIGAISYYLFPHAYLDLYDLKILPVVGLFIRDLLLIVLTILSVVYLRRMKASE